MELPEPNDGDQNPSTHRKKRRARRKAIMKQLWSDYTKNTSLHCLKYTTESSFHYIERIFWMITFTLSLGMCLWLIRNVWHKWEASPVIVSFSEKVVPVELVPFPSLTICPQIKARASVYNYTENFKMFFAESSMSDGLLLKNNSDSNATAKIPTAEEIKRFQDISLICPLPFYMADMDSDSITGPDVTNESTIHEILHVSPNLGYFHSCYWLGVERSCHELFKEVLTGEGVCFNFNGLAANEIFRTEIIQKHYNYSNVTRESSGWNLNIGYNNSDDADYMQQYPYRGQYTSHRPYLEVIFITPKEDYDGYCNVINKGFKIYTQHPASHPQSSVYSYAVLPGQMSALALKVNMMDTSKKLEGYDPDVRQCFFATEKYLKYFKLYTASNCMLECMSNFTFQRCECVSFHMPYSDSRSICTVQKSDCLRKARASNRKLMEFIEDCDCLPSCNSITYEAEILKTEFNLEKSMTNFFKLSGVEDAADIFSSYEYSKLEVYYRDSGFVTITRSELFGVTDFLANIGGLLGLFLGFSFLSFIEIVYFFTISYEYSKLEVYYRDSGFVTITRSELFGVTDFLANIGGLLGLFLGFSFLSFIEIVYFFTIRLGFTCRRDINNEKDGTNSGFSNIEETGGVTKVKHI